MEHQKTIERDNGIQYLIEVSVFLYEDNQFYACLVMASEDGIQWYHISDPNYQPWELRNLKYEEMIEYHMKKYLEHVTSEEILEAKLELWNKIKPI